MGVQQRIGRRGGTQLEEMAAAVLGHDLPIKGGSTLESTQKPARAGCPENAG
jgi:hypothetical protein